MDIQAQVQKFAEETGKILPVAECPLCHGRFWIEPRDNGAHELQCPACFDEGYLVPLRIDGQLLFTKADLPLPGEHRMAEFSQRAAIRQHDGGMNRAEAEKGALRDIEILQPAE